MLKSGLIAVALLASTSAMAASNLSGNYLLTLTAAKPSAYTGAQVCATLTETGGVLGWQNSGTVSISGTTGSFFVVGRQLLAWFSVGGGSAVFTANLVGGGMGISGTAFTEFDQNGNATLTAAYSASAKGGC